MVNAPKNNFSPLLAGKYGKSTKQSTRQYHQANRGERGLEAEWGRELGALRRVHSKTQPPAEKRRETHFSSNEEKEKWIEDYVERDTAVARHRVEDVETVIMQELTDMTTAESPGATTRTPETTVEAMANVIGDSLSYLAISNDVPDGDHMQDYRDDTEFV